MPGLSYLELPGYIGLLMSDAELIQYITGNFKGIQIVEAQGNSFIYYAPDGKVPEKTFPFATLMTGDEYDKVSNLARPGIYRLNVGVSKETFLQLFGAVPAAPGESGLIEGDYEFTALDRFLPHPYYGYQCWVSVLNPGPDTWEKTRELLQEAYETTVRKKSGSKA